MIAAATAIDRRSRNLYVLSHAATSAHLTRALLATAAEYGYRMLRSSKWSDHHRMGLLTVCYRDQLVYSTCWSTNNSRPVPESFYTGTAHHDAVLDALDNIVRHAHDNGVPLLLDPRAQGFYLPAYMPDTCFDSPAAGEVGQLNHLT